jgi:tRNA threonylcarbamoyladenosine biosynthesis protein TsaB
MPLLLNIDTATSYASVGFSRDGVLVGMRSNETQKEHASFLQPAIDELVRELGIPLKTIDAVALTIGPGSYTGLRVGLSSAKGIAYALGKPLIPVDTLEVMAHAAEKAWESDSTDGISGNSGPLECARLFCPMIDARREEVFTAIYAPGGEIRMEPCALILSESAFDPYISNNLLIFSGDGSLKWKSAYTRSSARFLIVQHSVADLAVVAEKHLRSGDPEPLAYLQPLYLKEFHKNS